jgi:hypothetical protein
VQRSCNMEKSHRFCASYRSFPLSRSSTLELKTDGDAPDWPEI